MITKEMAEKRLEQLYGAIGRERARTSDRRNWCITVLLACLAASASGKIEVTSLQAIALPIMPIVLFWLLDGFYCSFILRHQSRAADIERAITNETYNSIDPTECFWISGYDKIGFKEKVGYLLAALFVHESVSVFYLVLLVGTIVFRVVLR